MTLDVQIEAVLFYRTEPVSKRELGAFLGVTLEEVSDGLTTLSTRLQEGATRILDTGETVQLVSAPDVSALIEKLRKEELTREIGRAGAETLAIVLYRSPLSRAQIDFIRGVNSSFILRNLLVRGLIERVPHPMHPSSFQYIPSAALFAHLGITKKEDLPEYGTVMDTLDTFEKTSATEKEEEQTVLTATE